MGEPTLAVDQLVVDFATPGEPVHAVRGISFSLAPQEVLGIVGESGSGKSVTALAAMGLLPKNARVSGSVTYRRPGDAGAEGEASWPRSGASGSP